MWCSGTALTFTANSLEFDSQYRGYFFSFFKRPVLFVCPIIFGDHIMNINEVTWSTV